MVGNSFIYIYRKNGTIYATVTWMTTEAYRRID